MRTYFCEQHDLDEMLSEARLSEEKARNSMLDAARLAEELRAEQEPVLSSYNSTFSVF